MDERRERDPDTGEDTFFQTGAGIGDIFGKIAAKITGKTAKKLAAKAAEKGVEKFGEKTGKLIGEKIYDKFSSKTRPPKQKEKKLWLSCKNLQQINFNMSRMFTIIFFKNNKNIIKRDERKF